MSIKQTNRTILFEEINPEKNDLITMIGDVKKGESLSDEKIKEIHQELLVKNFDEFLEKFAPTVYSFYNAANQKVIYTLKKPENIPADYISEIKLDQNNDFLKMLFTLIDTKRSQGIINVDFRFEKVLDMISPKKVMEDIKQVRKEVHYLYGKYEELEDGDPKKLDMGDTLNYKFDEARQNYSNVMAMLPLAIEDIKTRLLFGSSQENGKAEALQIGRLTMSESGELKIIEAPKTDNTSLMLADGNRTTALIEIFGQDYESSTDDPSSYVKDLVTRTFCPLPSIQDEIDIEKEVANYNAYLNFYKEAKDDFIKTAKPLVEKILGAKMFFDQYATKSKGMVPTLLVTNAKLDMTVKSNMVPRLEAFLDTVNSKTFYDNTIWFGIVPAVEIDSAKRRAVGGPFAGNAAPKKQEGNTFESLTALLQILKEYRIQLFFNFQANEETTFNNVAVTGIEKYVDKCQALLRKEYSEFAIPCLPNFTVIPKDKSGVLIDAQMENTAEGVIMSKENILKLWIEGVYIDASYVAAGIVAAYQCPDYLKEIFPREANKKYPGVRFDIERGDNSLKVVTTMAKEITGFTSTIKDAIGNRNFGFIFSSENAQLNDRNVIKDITRITVYKARCLATKDDVFEPIYKTLVSTYVERILRYQTNDFKQDKIESFFSKNPESQKMKWKADTISVNAIIQDKDDIDCIIEDDICTLDLVFNGDSKNLKVEINKK